MNYEWMKFRAKEVNTLRRGKEKSVIWTGKWIYWNIFGKRLLGIWQEKVSDRIIDINDIDPDTIGIYINEKDKNGKEVFSGDIVKPYVNNDPLEPLVIKYLDHSFVTTTHDNEDSVNCTWYFDFEVIGNVYDNPDWDKK